MLCLSQPLHLHVHSFVLTRFDSFRFVSFRFVGWPTIAHTQTQATSLFAPDASTAAASSGGASPVKPAPFALDPEVESGPKKELGVDEFMEEARANFLASKAAYDAQKAKVRKSSM